MSFPGELLYSLGNYEGGYCLQRRIGIQSWTVNAIADLQVYVIPFYEKLGYVQEGERFDEDGGSSFAFALPKYQD